MTREGGGSPATAVLCRALLALAVALVAAWPAAAGEQWGWLGVRIRDLSEQEMEELSKRLGPGEGVGVLIAEVMPDTPAQASALRAGDLVVAIDGRPVVETRALQRLVGRTRPGQELRLVVLRERARQEVRILVGRMPPDAVAERVVAEFGFFVREGTEERLPVAQPRVPVVTVVAEGSSAARGGLVAGDQILAVNDRAVATVEEFRRGAETHLLRDPLRLRIERRGERLDVILPPVAAGVR
jgi:serine protease Do